MSNALRRLLVLLLLLLSLAACNLPAVQVNQGPSAADQAATIVASTLTAQAAAASPTGAATTPFASPVVSAATPTGKPTLFINTNNASCRSGPGADFKVIATFAAGTSVDMIGKDTADSFWIVKDPTSLDLCWVQVQDATPGGNFESLPEMTPAAVSQGVPARPGSISYNFFCDNSSLTVTLSWTDAATNENGYRVFRKGSQVADLPANSTTYNEKIGYTIGTPENYGIVAYNDAGVSDARSTPTFSCQ